MIGDIALTNPQSRRGQGLVEFSLVTFMTVIMLLFVVEAARMVLVYTSLANAARAGVRYAVVHGSTRPTTGCAAVDCASGPGINPLQVVTVVQNFASAGLLSMSNLTVNVTYLGSSNAPGQFVYIHVAYLYDPLTTYFSTIFPTALSLGSVAQGVIVF